MEPVLTVGMAAYNDAAPLFFVIQSLLAHHPGVPVELLVIETTPAPDPRVRSYVEGAGGTWLHRPDLEGTAAPRDRLFRVAHTPWVLCLDSHVLLEPGGLAALDALVRADPRAHLLVQGPLVGPGHAPLSHWRPTHPPALTGEWDHDPRVFRGEPFDIPAQGLGLFAMATEHWPGFHPRHSGFGGEEGYLHELVRRRGGRAVCLPALGWRHWFRDLSVEPVGYAFHGQDHYFNLHVGHRELGIDAADQLRASIGVPDGVRAAVERAAEAVQPWGQFAPRPPAVDLVGVWYSNNAAPHSLLKRSLASVQKAAQSSRHRVRVGTSTWGHFAGNPFPEAVLPAPRAGSHAAICRQIRLALAAAGGVGAAAGVVFLEHDVLYPPDYFDRVGDALARHPHATGTSNRDYIGLNPTGWLPVRERHEPLHQLALRPDVFLANLDRAEADCREQGWCYLEPADKSGLVALDPPERKLAPPMPAVHVNHAARFTSHGEVVYEAYSGGRVEHPYWGRAEAVWPTDGPPADPEPAFASPAEWADAAAAEATDIGPHLPALRRLAAGLDRACVVSIWAKAGPVGAALAAAGCKIHFSGGHVAGASGRLAPLCPPYAVTLDARDSLAADPVDCDLLFVDTLHTKARLAAELDRHLSRCRRYLVVHCTATFGEVGDDGSEGVVHALQPLLGRGWRPAELSFVSHGLWVLERTGPPPGV